MFVYIVCANKVVVCDVVAVQLTDKKVSSSCSGAMLTIQEARRSNLRLLVSIAARGGVAALLVRIVLSLSPVKEMNEWRISSC